jgi:hypothetical protein
MAHPRTRSARGAALTFAFALVATACSDGLTAPVGTDLQLAGPLTSDVMITETTVGSPEINDPANWYRRIWVCKVGTNADFAVTVNGGAPTAVSITDGQCKMVHLMDSPDQNQIDTVTVTEIASALTVLDSIVVDSTHNLLKFRLPTITGTPGYWKQKQHFGNWTLPYTPNTKFKHVFANAFPGKTLLQVLGQGGGGLNALGRHTVAALLNAASSGVEYDLTVDEVIAAFNAAYQSGDYEEQKDVFADLNEQGCPLGNTGGGGNGGGHNGGGHDNDHDEDCDDDHHGHRGHHHRNVRDYRDCDRDGRHGRGGSSHGGWSWGWGRGRP